MRTIRLLRDGTYQTPGKLTINRDGRPEGRQRTDEVVAYTFDWSRYFTRVAEVVTVTILTRNCTAAKVDGTDNTVVTVSAVSQGDADLTVTIAITSGETFKMVLDVVGEYAT
jgi:hypothetical protein